MRLNGSGGTVAVGYQRAGTIGAWHAEWGDLDRITLTIALRHVDTYWIMQDPLDVAVDLGGRQWRWRHVHRLSVDPWTLIASGLPESARVNPAEGQTNGS